MNHGFRTEHISESKIVIYRKMAEFDFEKCFDTQGLIGQLQINTHYLHRWSVWRTRRARDCSRRSPRLPYPFPIVPGPLPSGSVHPYLLIDCRFHAQFSTVACLVPYWELCVFEKVNEWDVYITHIFIPIMIILSPNYPHCPYCNFVVPIIYWLRYKEYYCIYRLRVNID